MQIIAKINRENAQCLWKTEGKSENIIMLNEGLKNFDNASVIKGIVAGEQPDSLGVLERVSEDCFSTSTRGFLLEYCKIKFGRWETEDYLENHVSNPLLTWVREYLDMKKKWASAPDTSAKMLIAAICAGKDEDVKEAVNAGGCIMTSDMLFSTIPFSDLSSEAQRYLFVNAMNLPIRCMAVLALCEEISKNQNSGLYGKLCNMLTILIDVLIKNEGV